MRVYKVLDFETYEKLMEIYRNKYQKLEDTQIGGGNSEDQLEEEEEEGRLSKDQLQEPEVRVPQWTTFEQTVAEIRARQKDKKGSKKK